MAPQPAEKQSLYSSRTKVRVYSVGVTVVTRDLDGFTLRLRELASAATGRAYRSSATADTVLGREAAADGWHRTATLFTCTFYSLAECLGWALKSQSLARRLSSDRRAAQGGAERGSNRRRSNPCIALEQKLLCIALG